MDSILESLFGNVGLMIMVGNKPAVEIKIKDKKIILNIKNPLLAVELGIEEYVKKDDNKADILKTLKGMGYKITIKYGILEIDL